MPPANARPAPQGPADVWQVLEALGVDPAAHFARLLLPESEVDDKRRDEAAKLLLPYCYGRKGTQGPAEEDGKRVGYVLCED